MALTKVIGDGAGTLNSLDISGVTASTVGQSLIPEFISNLFLAGNSASSASLTSCFTSTYSVYRLIGVIGGDHSDEAGIYITLLSGNSATTIDSNWYGAGRHGDDSSAEGAVQINANNVFIINPRQASTGFSIVDMHLYMQPSGITISGNMALHDQGGDRGFYIFNAKNSSSTVPTEFKISSSESGNMSASNLSVYGMRIRQNATSKMTGSYS